MTDLSTILTADAIAPVERRGVGAQPCSLPTIGQLEVAGSPGRSRQGPRTATGRVRSMLYHRLIVGVLVLNVGVVVHQAWSGSWRLVDGSALAAMSTLTLVNVTIAVLVRNQGVLNAVYRLAGRAPSTWPLGLRRRVSEVHHIGGVHVGCAVAGSAWLVAFTVAALMTEVRHAALLDVVALTSCVGLAIVLVVMTVCAVPPVRMRAHNVFENSHRWGGWTAVALFWVLTVDLAVTGRGTTSPLGALVSDWHVWVLVVVTGSVGWPWLRLRRVPITVVRPSAHAVIVHLDYGVQPSYASGVGISLDPLREWHAFATVTTPGQSGYRLLISRAGDWTGRFIDDPPTHVWVRGVPVVAPMAKVATMYRRVVYVVTGSGIGPCLGQILADRVPSRLVWSTRNPRRTYGDSLVDELTAVQPDAVIWDTTEHGTPDLHELAVRAYVEFDAEAVFIVSNKATTIGLVRQLERDGIPAFGPIWDS